MANKYLLTYLQANQSQLQYLSSQASQLQPFQNRQNHSVNSLTTVFNLPPIISQSYLNGRNGSNACTVITCLLAKQMLAQGLLPVLSITNNSLTLCKECLTMLIYMIQQGNQLHDRLHQQTGQINYSPREVCRLLPQLKLRVKTDNVFPNRQSLILGKKIDFCASHATTVIILPDKSIFLHFQILVIA